MSIKKLFESSDKKRNYLSDTTEKEAFADVESGRNVRAVIEKQRTYVPGLNYAVPSMFVKYGSAYLYYKGAMTRVYDYYPYDGSDAEQTEFYNQLLDVEKYLFDYRYPRTTGYATISADGWGAIVPGKDEEGYRKPSIIEHITLYGGPHTASYKSIKDTFPDSPDSKRQNSNIYDTDIYTSAGLPSDYGSGSRESNLKANFDTGVTVEFWLQTGSLNVGGTTEKQLVFDMWNSASASGSAYGRISIALTSSAASGGSPFLLTVQSGNVWTGAGFSGLQETQIGTGSLTNNSLSSWSHYAFVLYNSGSSFVTKLYVNGALNDTIVTGSTCAELNSKNMLAYLGAQVTASILSPGTRNGGTGWAKLSGSIDEFRYWKVARNAKEIGLNYNTQVGGGTNTDISNTTLGVYYKFNEGVTDTASVDSTVLDYSGRLSNGAWTGYGTNSRNTGSAIVSASAAAEEHKDPIIYSFHPDVLDLQTTLLTTGENYDLQNNSALVNMLPSWVLENDEGHAQTSLETDLRKMSHIVAAYLDQLRVRIGMTQNFKSPTYTPTGATPYPFAQHMPQSLGLYTPQLFVDASVLETFSNRNEERIFESDLIEAKNLIYLNLYNNLTEIFKAKGTEKAIKNVLRCFSLDDRLIKLKTYSNENVYELRNNLEQVLYENSGINFNFEVDGYGYSGSSGVVYQYATASSPLSRGYISGTNTAGREELYGCTAEASVVFPAYNLPRGQTKMDRTNLLTSSLFGMTTPIAADPGSTTQIATSSNNFQVFAIRDEENSKNVRFMLTSSYYPHPFSAMVSDTFFNVYDNEEWHFSVRIKPNSDLVGIVSASFDTGGGVPGSSLTASSYDVVFRGVNAISDNIQNSFTISQSLNYLEGSSFLKSPKRLYVGALRTNITGALQHRADTRVLDLKYWTKYLQDGALDQHLFDDRNAGLSASYQNLSPLDPVLNEVDTLNLNTLALHWTFANITGSDGAGTFPEYVTDMSSGSAELQDNYGWIGGVAGWQHTGIGYGFPPTSSQIATKELYNSLRFIDPEQTISSDMINIVSNDELAFGTPQNPPSFFQIIEKSMYDAVSEEMLVFFAGSIDFNNVIGESVNRYRERYKTMEKLRQIFFQKVSGYNTVDKYVKYYKWFDDALSTIISQLLPASTELEENVANVVESHVLERNKYKSQYPTIEFRGWGDLETVIQWGIDVFGDTEEEAAAAITSWESPLPSSPRATNIRGDYWKYRAERTSAEISSSNTTVDSQRENIRKVVSYTRNTQEAYTLATLDGQRYTHMPYFKKYGQLPRITAEVMRQERPYRKKGQTNGAKVIHGGTNFRQEKAFEISRKALQPAGPVNKSDDVYVPLNVLLAPISQLEPLNEINLKNSQDDFSNNRHRERDLKVYYGPNYEDGLGYNNVSSRKAFPFNILNSNVTTGYNKQICDRASSSLEIVNLHVDGYGPNMERPMQGPFTEHNVGGLQSRHIALNTGTDTYLTRPEAWKILLGTCTTIDGVSGAIGMVGADYPYPEANEEGANPYPMTGAQKAVYYRGMTAKRPVNIRNISQSLSSPLGNYSRNYQVIHSVGAYSNPRQFIEFNEQVSLPVQITELNLSPTQGRTILSNRRAEEGHFVFTPDYSIGYLRSGSTGRSIIKGRFSACPSIETSNQGYCDIRSGEFSPYNALNYRYLSVIRPFQNMSGTVSEPVGIGTPGIRVVDINDRDFGLRMNLTQHAGRFGRSALLVTDPGASYTQAPSFNKINRNPRRRLIETEPGVYLTASQYDNYWVQHTIPRADRQYAWITGAIGNDSNLRYYGYAPVGGDTAGMYSSSANGWEAYFNFITQSDVGTSNPITQPAVDLNYYVTDPADDFDDNTLGKALTTLATTYYNTTLLDVYSITPNNADYFNLLMTKRRSAFKTRNAPLADSYTEKVLRRHRDESVITLKRDRQPLERYTIKPVSMRGRPVSLNMTINEQTDVTVCGTYNNNFIYFSDLQLNNAMQTSLPKSTTPEQLMAIANLSEEYNLNWILYTEMLFPSALNEFLSSSSERIDYDNRFWRNTLEDRYLLGSETIKQNSWGLSVSQSSWPLDEPRDFTTRTGIPAVNLPSKFYLRGQNRAGELQNAYYHVLSGTQATNALYRAPSLVPSALYARKHTLPQSRTVVSPSGMPIPETGSAGITLYSADIDTLAGEAAWQADTQAGIVAKTGSTVSFESHPSQPWFSTYEDYKEDLRTVAKDYAIVPEFRISEHLEELKKLGTRANNKFDWFEIVGTDKNSSQSSFYKDYSNSEFMGRFTNIHELSKLTPKEIKLVCSGTIRFNPYKGFYPAQRTIDLTSQLSRSYSNSFLAMFNNNTIEAEDGAIRPLLQSLCAPGVLFNSIKSGIAVDYPIISDSNKVLKTHFGNTLSSAADVAWMILATSSVGASGDTVGYEGGVFWDYRVPFESIITPEAYLGGLEFVDMEPHPSCSITGLTASFVGKQNDDIYTSMASNWAAQVGAFFLKDGQYTRLESEMVTDDLRFEAGSTYASRLVLKRSTTGPRTYQNESGSSGDNTAYSRFGARRYFSSSSPTFGKGTFPIPQDPRQHDTANFYENFTMYSRPTAFGPPIAGRPISPPATAAGITASLSYPSDSLIGCNWAFTPPYYNGEAWVDFIFTPSASVAYDLERILSETKMIYWRADPGVSASAGIGTLNMSGTQLLPTFKGNIPGVGAMPYDGENVNANAMQISASFLLGGVERVLEAEEDKFGNQTKSVNKTVGKKWVIQPKFETPMLNFNNTGIHPITNADGNLELPTFASSSVPRGMWHQFGVIPETPDKGIFIEIGDIPPNWLKNHYMVVNTSSVYNGFNVQNGAAMHRKMKPFTDVVRFKPENRRARLGEIAESQTIREAIVAVPYVVDSNEDTLQNSSQEKYRNRTLKKFFSVDKEKIDAAMTDQIGSIRGDSLNASGESVRLMVQKMQRYVLPPMFDFINDPTIDPVAMYFFEFEYELDQDDLSYIWQNIAPRDYKKMTKAVSSVAYSLDDNELLASEDVLQENMRWMVFKVKQRATETYTDMIAPQVGSAAGSKNLFDDNEKTTPTYPVEANWPYDYLSFVETVKFDVSVLYKEDESAASMGEDNKTTTMLTGVSSDVQGHTHAYNIESSNGGNGYTDYAYHPENKSVKHRHRVIDGVVQSAQSDCYPNCKEAYGVDGVPEHIHALTPTQTTNKSFSSNRMNRRLPAGISSRNNGKETKTSANIGSRSAKANSREPNSKKTNNNISANKTGRSKGNKGY
tara:strand:+ start:14925 stop:24653 length:9729 start_codon:yes stop_codon:yes gene_type:complete